MHFLNWIQKSLGLNRNVLALSIARMADGIGNSILFVIIPLYVAQLPHQLVRFPEPLMVGRAAVGLRPCQRRSAAVYGPAQRSHGHYKRIIQAGLGLIGLATLAFIFAEHYLDLLGLRIAQGFSAFAFSIAFSSLMVGRLVFQVPCGRISDFIGRKPFVLLGLLLMAVVTGLLGEVSSLFQFILLRFIQGIAAAAIVAPALAFAGDVAHGDSQGRQGQQMSIVTMGFGWGIAFGPLLAGALSIFSFELPFLVDGVLCFIGAVAVYLFMTETVDGGQP